MIDKIKAKPNTEIYRRASEVSFPPMESTLEGIENVQDVCREVPRVGIAAGLKLQGDRFTDMRT